MDDTRRGRIAYVLSVGVLLLIGTILIFSPAKVIAETNQENLSTVNRIVISLENFQLLAFNGNKFVKAYPIATGADTGPTPIGKFKIINKLKEPWYTPDDKPAKAPGPNNPLGVRWMGIDKPSYGIHGTRNPSSIGTRASAGCIRLFNMHVKELFEMIEIGTKVTIKKSFSKGESQIASQELFQTETSS